MPGNTKHDGRSREKRTQPLTQFRMLTSLALVVLGIGFAFAIGAGGMAVEPLLGAAAGYLSGKNKQSEDELLSARYGIRLGALSGAAVGTVIFVGRIASYAIALGAPMESSPGLSALVGTGMVATAFAGACGAAGGYLGATLGAPPRSG